MYQIIEKRVLHHEFHDYIILLLKKKKKLEQDSEQLEREVGTVQEKKKERRGKKEFKMGKLQTLLMILGIICTCTCDGRTDCGNHAQISLLTSIHDDPSCRKLSAKGVLIYEAAKLLTEIHNNKSGGYDIGK